MVKRAVVRFPAGMPRIHGPAFATESSDEQDCDFGRRLLLSRSRTRSRHAATPEPVAAVSNLWEIMADNLSKAGWSSRCVSAIDREPSLSLSRRGDGKRFIVRADEKLSAFIELESAIRPCDELLSCDDNTAINNAFL